MEDDFCAAKRHQYLFYNKSWGTHEVILKTYSSPTLSFKSSEALFNIRGVCESDTLFFCLPWLAFSRPETKIFIRYQWNTTNCNTATRAKKEVGLYKVITYKHVPWRSVFRLYFSEFACIFKMLWACTVPLCTCPYDWWYDDAPGVTFLLCN